VKSPHTFQVAELEWTLGAALFHVRGQRSHQTKAAIIAEIMRAYVKEATN
jgi:hypothetical protein